MGEDLTMLRDEKRFTHVVRCCYGSEIKEAVHAARIDETRLCTEFLVGKLFENVCRT